MWVEGFEEFEFMGGLLTVFLGLDFDLCKLCKLSDHKYVWVHHSHVWMPTWLDLKKYCVKGMILLYTAFGLTWYFLCCDPF